MRKEEEDVGEEALHRFREEEAHQHRKTHHKRDTKASSYSRVHKGCMAKNEGELELNENDQYPKYHPIASQNELWGGHRREHKKHQHVHQRAQAASKLGDS